MLTLKHLKTLRHVSILIEHHQGVRRCLVKVTEFNHLKPKDIYIYISYRSANLQTLHFKYLFNKYTY